MNRLVNAYNFLRWYNVSEEQVATVTDPARGYLRDRNNCDYTPLLINGETSSFYINTTDGLNTIITDPTTAKLKLVDYITGQVINADIATLIQDTFVDSDGNNVYTFYASVAPSNIPPGTYIFRIGDNTDNFLDSSPVLVPMDAAYNNYSCLCKFRHDRYYYGVNYQNLSDFYQQFRLHLNEIDAQYENDKEVYNEVTTGKQRTYNNFKKEVRTLEAYYFDAAAHDAAAVMFDSDELFVNGRMYTAKQSYKRNTNVLTKKTKGSVDLYDYDFASANRCLIPITAATDDCVAVSIPDFTLPDGEQGVAYSSSITITGDQPFQLSDKVEPPGLHWSISGKVLSLTGTPSTNGTINASVTVSNCSDSGSDSFSGTVDIAEPPPPNGIHWLTETVTEEDADHKYTSNNIQGDAGTNVTFTVTAYTNTESGVITIDGIAVTAIGNVFNYTLDGSGLSTDILFNILHGTYPGHPYSISATFTITGTGTVGTPADYTISKTFSS